MKLIFCSLIALVLLAGCHPVSEYKQGEPAKGSYAKYATGFELDDHISFKILHVYDPWQSSKGVSFSYVLAADPSLVPDSLEHLIFIKTPVRRVITLSTTHVAMIDQLGQEQSIKGVSGSGFIFTEKLRKRITNQEVKDVGYDQGLSYETIVGINPDVLFMYGVEGNVMATSRKLRELEIPVVFCGDYLETHPLGKAEWIRFFSVFYDLEREAEVFFKDIDSLYHSHKSLTGNLMHKPWVLTGLPWKDTWYMAGGKSFAARLIQDAGGVYLWADHASTQAVPMDLESVYARAVNADIWINPGAATSLNDLNDFDERFQDLRVLKTAKIFNNNLRINASGGNDYWESGAVRPDLVLKDLIKVFHPDLLTDDPFIYYRQLK